MRIICLCKRHPQNRDLWERPYGRFYHLAQGLADKGHETHLVLANYQSGREFSTIKQGLHWHSYNIFSHPFHYYKNICSLILQSKTDWLIGFSDIYYGVLAQHLSNRFNVACLIDAYDNYESYIPWLKPLHWLWRRALRRCTAITAPGQALLVKMSAGRPIEELTCNTINSAGGSCPASDVIPKLPLACQVIPMAADPIFNPGNKQNARHKLQLPHDLFLLGYSGSIHHSRGISRLFTVFERLKKQYTTLGLVLSGRKQKNLHIPIPCFWLGYIDDALMPCVYQALDLTLALNEDSHFGNYSYPVKIYESLASGTPVLSSSTQSTREIFAQNPQALFFAESTDGIVKTISEFIHNPFPQPPHSSGWDHQITQLNDLVTNFSHA